MFKANENRLAVLAVTGMNDVIVSAQQLTELSSRPPARLRSLEDLLEVCGGEGLGGGEALSGRGAGLLDRGQLLLQPSRNPLLLRQRRKRDFEANEFLARKVSDRRLCLRPGELFGKR